MTKIILCGCNGKMGKVIQSCVAAREDCRIVAGIDINTEVTGGFPVFSSLAECSLSADVVIDFSHPSLLNELLEYCVKTQTPLVLATTGYSEQQIEQIHIAAKQTAVFFSFNMSLGVNLLVELSKKAAEVLGDQFDIEVIEKHHNQKIDAPSGTAIMLVDEINHTLDEQYKYVYDRHSVRKKRDKNEIGIHSVRGGTIVGEHEVIFAGRDEIVTLSHSARSKEVFAVGAVKAALYLSGKVSGLYNMGDMLA